MSSKPHPLGHCICRTHLPRPWNRPEHWTGEEVAYLEASYGIIDVERIAKHLGRTPGGVRAKAKRLGVRMLDAGMSAREVGRVLGVDERHVSKELIRRHGVLRATPTVRHGSHRLHLVSEAELERFIREHGEWVDPDRMPESVYRDLALAGGRWYSLPDLLPLTGRHPHALSEELRRGRWPGRRRGRYWRVHESVVPAIAASAAGRRRADPDAYQRTLAYIRAVRKGIATRDRPEGARWRKSA